MKYEAIFDSEFTKLETWLEENYGMGCSYLRYDHNKVGSDGIGAGSAELRDSTVYDSYAANGGEKKQHVLITCPPPTNLANLAVFLHEVGHVYNFDCFDPDIVEADGSVVQRFWPNMWISSPKQKQRILTRELKASKWALNRMQELGLPTKWAREVLYRCYRTYEREAYIPASKTRFNAWLDNPHQP